MLADPSRNTNSPLWQRWATAATERGNVVAVEESHTIVAEKGIAEPTPYTPRPSRSGDVSSAQLGSTTVLPHGPVLVPDFVA
jgi:hypothetical protein